jgi:hypothetical protein
MLSRLMQGRHAPAMGALGLAAIMILQAPAPATPTTAGQISTRNIILGAVATTAALILYNQYKHEGGATVVGVTADGGRVFIDGRVVFPNGIVVYLSNDGRRPCDFEGDEDRCGPEARGFLWRYPWETQWHGRGLHRGWEKGRGNPHGGDEDDGG